MRHLQNIFKITTEKEEEEKMFSLCYDSIEVPTYVGKYY